jgi:hypothetical protein
MQLPTNEIICGDCLEVMADWPDGCVDLVLKKDLTTNTESGKMAHYEQSRTKEKTAGRATLETTESGNRVAVLSADVVDRENSQLLRHISNGHEQSNGAAEDSVAGAGSTGQVQRAIQGRLAKHSVSADDREGHLRELWGNGQVGDPPQERGPSGQPSAKSSGSLRKLPQQLPQNSMVETTKVACITDPPYGIGWKPRINHQNQHEHWIDNKAFDPRPFLRISTLAAFCGANYFADLLPPSNSWLAWIKRPISSDFSKDTRTYSTVELIWTNFLCKCRHFVHVWDGGKRQGHPENRNFCHPSQKPIELMLWCLSFVPADYLILDPFCGSGTTCVAAKKLGRRYIGIDISPEYCEIARKRLEAVDTGVPVKEAQAGQMALWR